jgi:hypothetical protein
MLARGVRLLVLVAVSMAAWSVQAAEWTITHVTPYNPHAAASVGVSSAVALHPNGLPRIVAEDVLDLTLEMAWYNGTTWSIAAVPIPGDIQGRLNLAFDAEGNPHIAYTLWNRAPGTRVEYAERVGSTWQVHQVPWYSESPSMVRAPDGTIHLAYRTLTGPGYATWDGSSWHGETVGLSDGRSADDASLVLDAKGEPHIAFYEPKYDNLMYAWRDNGTWTVETVLDRPYDDGHYASLALDSAGNPHIASYFGNLAYSKKVNGTWVSETVDATSSATGYSPRLLLDKRDVPHIIYRDSSDLLYATWDGDSWFRQAVDNESLVRFCLIDAMMADDGRVHLSYYDDRFGMGLVYATAQVPEPGSLMLMLAGAGMVGAMLRRRRRP